MILAKKCCFCLSLQMGCIMIAIFEIFLSGMNIDYIFFLFNNTYKREVQYKFPEAVLFTSLQLVTDLLTIVASVLLLFAIITQYFWLFWATLSLQVVQGVYLILFSIISASIGSNLIVNISFWHNITYWIYVLIWLALTAYFLYIIFSCYRQLKERERETENVNNL
ncbi:uncharacterized protein LOC108107889 isoform X1 [Drosophila eugracilis]|uniref:uncharacterized protein LOC108107889 isoform X1 n=1 Tax=Drosophila eugracilis TaxID=29029 RepID=UPI0007E888A7|nr:uncharacterized protein LOC108107889 isoform X1 [Drosophila eugracilis]XP_017071172.1 uncharacterized protein LOC108107889 isoform X1 [Drosophila eugracilis]